MKISSNCLESSQKTCYRVQRKHWHHQSAFCFVLLVVNDSLNDYLYSSLVEGLADDKVVGTGWLNVWLNDHSTNWLTEKIITRFTCITTLMSDRWIDSLIHKFTWLFSNCSKEWCVLKNNRSPKAHLEQQFEQRRKMYHHLHPRQTGLGWMSILEPKTAQQARKNTNATFLS